jgi:tRNA-dihydrouridine synthase 2
LKAVVKAVTTIPVVVNGDVMCWEDIAKAKEATGKKVICI